MSKLLSHNITSDFLRIKNTLYLPWWQWRCSEMIQKIEIYLFVSCLDMQRSLMKLFHATMER